MPDDVASVLGRVWRFVRNTIIVVVGLCVLGGAIALAIYLWHEWQASKVAVVFEHKGKCDDPEYPLFVGFENNASKPIHKVSFFISARRPGYSTDLVGYGGRYETDRIIAIGTAVGACWRYPKLRDEREADNDRFFGRQPTAEIPDKGKLEWSVRLGTVSFGD